MSKIIIERKKSNNLRMPYSVLVDNIEVGQVQNGETIEFNIVPGEHTVIITSNENDFAEKIGAVTGGIVGVFIGRFLDRFIINKIKEKTKKNEVEINIGQNKELTIVCKAGEFEALIEEVK